MPTSSKFAIYRILGNDLPPRHARHNALTNLRFILENEKDFPETEKWWILNRIVDPAMMEQAIGRIERAGQRHIVIAFDPEAHFAAFLDESGLPRRNGKAGPKVDSVSDVMQREWRIRHKSQAIVNINNARNLALTHGGRRARWILPLDGGVMFTPAGWQSFLVAANPARDVEYILINMQRMQNYESIGSPGHLDYLIEEPQLAFRSDAADVFDEHLRYGHRNKAELLSRLQIPGPWHGWTAGFWDKDAGLPSHGPAKFATGGFVLRLATGSTGTVDANSRDRWRARFEGIEQLSASLDVSYARKVMARARHVLSFAPVGKRDRNQLDNFCAQLLLAPIHTVLDKATSAPSGDPHDFLCTPRYPAPPAPLSRLARLRAAFLGPSGKSRATGIPGKDDRDAFGLALRGASVLAHGAGQLNNQNYAGRARVILETWFVNPATRMNPTLHYAQWNAEENKPNPFGLVSARDLWLLPQAVESLREQDALSNPSFQSLQDWSNALLKALKSGPQLAAALARPNNIATWAAAMAAHLYLFTGDVEAAMKLCREAPLRLAAQVAPDGTQPEELGRHIPLHYSLFNLEGWAVLVCAGLKLGMDLRRYRGQSGESLEAAIRHLSEARTSYTDYAEKLAYHDHRIATLLAFLAGEKLPANVEPFSPDIHGGLPPLWPLCLPRP